VGYGNEQASDANVAFAYDLALAAARDLWSLAGQLRSHEGERASAAVIARADWQGPKHDQFEQDIGQEGRDVTAVAAGLEDTARSLAENWARARGEQDRINKARYVDHELDDDNFLEDAWEWVAGEDDYGPPPGNPPTPGPPAFEPTRAPMYPEYENRR
jgi:hypothetical protein